MMTPAHDKLERLHAIIHGRVQGVGFRAATVDRAYALDLTGWVRNRADGAVETGAEGERESLERFQEWLHAGPPAARVERVDATWEAATGEFPDFRVRYESRM